MNKPNISIFLFAMFLFISILPQSAFAYIGPGSGVTFVGSIIALAAGLILGLIGFVWYPVKRLLRYVRERNDADFHNEDDE